MGNILAVMMRGWAVTLRALALLRLPAKAWSMTAVTIKLWLYSNFLSPSRLGSLVVFVVFFITETHKLEPAVAAWVWALPRRFEQLHPS